MITNMKLSPRAVNDLLNMVDHSRRDISYGVGGSFGDGNDFDAKAIKSVERAIEIVKKIVLERD